MCMMDGCAYVNDRYVCTNLCVPACVWNVHIYVYVCTCIVHVCIDI